MTSDKPDFGRVPADEVGDDEFKRLLGQALAGEPPLGVNRDEVLRRGQRRLRARRTVLAGGVAAAVVTVVVGAAALSGAGHLALQGEVVSGNGQTSSQSGQPPAPSPAVATPLTVYTRFPLDDEQLKRPWPTTVSPIVPIKTGTGDRALPDDVVAKRLTHVLAPALRLRDGSPGVPSSPSSGQVRTSSESIPASAPSRGQTSEPPVFSAAPPVAGTSTPSSAVRTTTSVPPADISTTPLITFSSTNQGYYHAAVDLGDESGVGALIVQVLAGPPGMEPLDCNDLLKLVGPSGNRTCHPALVVDGQPVLAIVEEGPDKLVRQQVISERADGTRISVTTANVADSQLRAGQRNPGRPKPPLTLEDQARIALLPGLSVPR